MPKQQITATDLPQHLIDLMSDKDRAELGLQSSADHEAATIAAKESIDAKSEREIQNTVEAWLRLRGYWPRSDAFLKGERPERGWYIHLHETKRNPILLDLLILGNDGRYIEIELKTASGGVREAQHAILYTCGAATLCRGAQEAIEIIKEWETKTKGNANEPNNDN